MINDELRHIVQSFCLMDDTFFNCFMKDNIGGMEYVINIIMKRKDLRVKHIETQHDVPAMFARGVRFDVFAIDSIGKHYDFEVQRADDGAIPQRARYNSSMMDYLNLNAGQNWNELPETYIIFITESDVLKGNLPIYHIERTIQELNRPFNDGNHIIYVNGSYQDDKSEIGCLMHDFRCQNPKDMKSKLLAKRMEYLKSTEAEVSSMCKIVEDYANKRFNDGIAQGISQGIAQGISQGISQGRIQEKIESARNMIKAELTTIEKLIASNLYTADEIAAISAK